MPRGRSGAYMHAHRRTDGPANSRPKAYTIAHGHAFTSFLLMTFYVVVLDLTQEKLGAILRCKTQIPRRWRIVAVRLDSLSILFFILILFHLRGAGWGRGGR